MKGKGFIGIIVILVVIVAILGSSYNKLVSLDVAVDGAWAEVNNMLKRRADLIPNLLETVKGYAAHEEKVLTEITEARSKFANASNPQEFAQADQELNVALTNLYAVAENYPDLKANQNFLEFQTELAGAENRIAVARMRYNETVTDYNSTIRSFPTNMIAGIFNFDRRIYFEIDQKDAEVPKVEF